MRILCVSIAAFSPATRGGARMRPPGGTGESARRQPEALRPIGVIALEPGVLAERYYGLAFP